MADQFDFQVDKLLSEDKLHPAIALPLFPLLAAEPEELPELLRKNLEKFIAEAPDYVMDQRMRIQYISDGLLEYKRNNVDRLFQVETKIKKLAVKAALDLLKCDKKYAQIVKYPENTLEQLFKQAELREEIRDGKVDNYVIWDGRYGLDGFDLFLIVLGLLIAGTAYYIKNN